MDLQGPSTKSTDYRSYWLFLDSFLPDPVSPPEVRCARPRPVDQDKLLRRGNPSVAVIHFDRQTPRNSLAIDLERLQLREFEKDVLEHFLAADHKELYNQ